MRALLDHNKVNHVAVLVDESSSMRPHTRTVPQVVDAYIKHLAARSKDYDQETRISVYAFNSAGTERCLVWDTDVLRIPSIDGRYEPKAMTALTDCNLLAISDLSRIWTGYGDHSFWITNVSDGDDTDSRRSPSELRRAIAQLGEEWTMSAYVPSQRSIALAEQAGLHRDNCEVWDPNGSFEQIGQSLRETADRFMEGRKQGVRGYSQGGLFVMNQVSVRDIERSLTPVTRGSYQILQNQSGGKVSIRNFVEMVARQTYYPGCAYYEFEDATVTIQGGKKIHLQVGAAGGDGAVYTGPAARQILGLPAASGKFKPSEHPGYSIFVESTSWNRAILPGQWVLVLR